MGTLSISPEIVDGALAVVVDEPRQALAVWKGRSRIDLHDLEGTWHDTALPPTPHAPSEWSRDDVLAHASVALAATDARSSLLAHVEPSDVAQSEPSVRIEVGDLRRAWLLRAKPWGYALWDGGQTVDVYSAEGGHQHAVEVGPVDLASMSHRMLELLDATRRAQQPQSSEPGT